MAFKYKGLRLKQPYLRKMVKSVPGVAFSRSSVAYDYLGNSVPVDTPIFQHKVPDGTGGFEIVNGIGIYESHTNILPSAESQSLDGVYTTAALTGTYTFQVEGEGSVVLSGGASGTVSFGNPITATLSSQAVTLTGTATLLQVLNKAYPLPWGLGGVTIAAESLTVPSSVLNIDTSGGTPNNGKLTIEFELYGSQAFKTTAARNRYVFIHSQNASLGTNQMDLFKHESNGRLYFRSFDSVNSSTQLYVTDPTTSNSFNKIAYKFANNELNGYLNGNSVVTPNTSPKLPSGKDTYLYIGALRNGLYQCNSIIRNFVVSKTKRTDTSITARSTQNLNGNGFVVDKDVSLVFPLKTDLRAYRIARC